MSDPATRCVSWLQQQQVPARGRRLLVDAAVAFAASGGHAISAGVLSLSLVTCTVKEGGHSDTGGSESGTGGSSGTSTAGATGTSTGTASGTDSATTSGSNSSGGGDDMWAQCGAARTASECKAVELEDPNFVCVWGNVWSIAVVDGECDVGPPTARCEPYTDPNPFCVTGPLVCQEPGYASFSYYRGSGSSAEVWIPSGGGCRAPFVEEVALWWQQCPSEELAGPEGVPDVCYCLCGGIPPAGGGSDTGTSTGTGP